MIGRGCEAGNPAFWLAYGGKFIGGLLMLARASLAGEGKQHSMSITSVFK